METSVAKSAHRGSIDRLPEQGRFPRSVNRCRRRPLRGSDQRFVLPVRGLLRCADAHVPINAKVGSVLIYSSERDVLRNKDTRWDMRLQVPLLPGRRMGLPRFC
jgi:hypothetical protein